MSQRILVVDDEKSILFALRHYFSQYGFEVDCASDRPEAASLISGNEYAVAILDLHLDSTESADGLAVAADLVDRSPETPIIVLTALGTPESEAEAARIGVKAFLRKPMRLAHVADVALGLISESEAASVAAR